jgi:hypothetical protein
MVEIKRYIITGFAVVVAGILSASGQQRTVIAGLEENAEYRALIEEESGLVKSADSLAVEISSLRGLLRVDTLGRAANSAAIVRMEEQGFEIRSRMARLASRINTIEQEWILASLAGEPTDDTPPQGDASQVEILSPEQLAELHDAQRAERELPPLFERYRENRTLLGTLADEYERATTQPEADSLGGLFGDLSVESEAMERRIGDEWGMIFDSKSYIYNLLADKQNRSDLLESFERGMERVREEQSRHTEAPTAIVNYVLQKRMLTAYELTMAEATGNSAAADSLRRAATQIPAPESLADLTPVELKERLFLDYSDIKIGGSPYNSSNPIPEVAVWPKGVIWRVFVGNFATRQSPSIFRNAHPIAVETGDDNRFKYFIGGFPTDSLANKAVEQLRKAGFRSPSAVVWMDGVYIDPEDADETTYRIEISGVEELSPETREIIASATAKNPDESTEETATRAKAEIVRAAGLFLITPLDAPEAVRLRTALEAHKATQPEMEIRLSKFSE